MSGAVVACGVAGVGYLGRHHARIYHELSGADLVGIYEVDDARAMEVCAAYGCRRFDSLEALAEACTAISVVVPTDRHAEVAVPLLKRGRHLLVEKPLCTNLDEAEAILGAAQASGAFVQVGHVEHFNPVMGYLEEVVDAPRFITADRLAPFQPRGTEVGVVLDLMIHDIGIVLQLVRSPLERIEGIGVQVLSRTEDIANARLVFANGCVANLNASRVSEKKLREIRVFQPAAYLSLDFMNQSGHLVQRTATGLAKEVIPIEKGEPLRLELTAFLESVRQREAPKVDGGLGRSALEVALEVTDRIRRGWT
ncbi:MAG: gfo/Idh/MocA family oxidoreductase [Puniceicoccaceae bacterium]|nr:MAG: gfo/Idh/MocA family oxidoreductase [Puniceicoccaceae bacterium]